MNRIHIITGNNIGNHHTNVFTAFGQSRIKIQLITISNKPLRMNVINMIGSQIVILIGFRPIRINPCMKFHPTFMTFINHKLHRIPIRRRRLTLYSCQKTAPRFQL